MRKIKKLLNDGVLVELEPIKRRESGITVEGAGDEALRIGRVLMAGRGKEYTDRFIPMPDIVGKRVGFLILAAKLRSEQTENLPPNQIIIMMGDLLFEIGDGVDIEVYG